MMVEDDDVQLVESIGGIMMKLKCRSSQLYKHTSYGFSRSTCKLSFTSNVAMHYLYNRTS
jgi:hypothetical protein